MSLLTRERETDRAAEPDLTAGVAARAADIERSRRLPGDLIETLKDAGYFRLLAPAAFGGSAPELADVLRVLESLARADGATGWVVGQVASAQLIMSYFPRRAVDQVYANGPDVLAAGAVAPKGLASREGRERPEGPEGPEDPADDDWRVTGQWPFVTGCEDATWIYVQSVVAGDSPAASAHGVPALRLLLFPREEVRILDTWSVCGLRGTGSHDVRLSRARCPHWRTTTVLGDSQPSMDDTIFRIPPLDQGGLYIAAVVLGIAQGALDDITAVAASGKRPAFSRERLSASAVFQERLGEAHMRLQGARALLYVQAEGAWASARTGRAVPVQERAVRRATVSTVMADCVAIVDAAYSLAGGSALYDGSPLQRRLRDIHAAAQHAYASRHHLGVVGGVLAGEPPAPGLF